MQPQEPNQNPNPGPGQQPPYQPNPEQPLTNPLPPAYPAAPQPQQPPNQNPQPNQQQNEQPSLSDESGQEAGRPQQMYYTRPLDPQQPFVSDELQKKTEESHKKYPELNLSNGEFVVSDVKRHPIGMLGIWVICLLAVVAIIAVAGMFVVGSRDATGGKGVPATAVGLGAALMSVLIILGGYIAAYVYKANRFYLTNESVIQNIQLSLFSNRQQTVSLGNIEDASYMKNGIIQTIFDYGTVRLSTQGDETTYRFTFASDPEKQVAKLNNAVEAFKNGRPVMDDDDPNDRSRNRQH